MLRSRSCRGVIGFAVATLMVSQGCYVYRPTTLPISAGAEIRVRGTPLDIYNGTTIRSTAPDCRASEVQGELRGARGDTLLIAPVRAVSGATPRRACKGITVATVVAPAGLTTIFSRELSGPRTTGYAVGVVAGIALVAAIIIVSQYSHADANVRTP